MFRQFVRHLHRRRPQLYELRGLRAVGRQRRAHPTYPLGNAWQWAANAAAHGVPVNGSPAVGAIAQWDASSGGASPDGHVAYVEAWDGTNLVISEDNYATGPFRWRIITAGDAQWPSHFKDLASAGQNRVSVLAPDSEVYAKDGLSGGWLDQAARAIAVSDGGPRQALLNSDHQVYAKDDLGAGGWLDQGAAAVKVVVGLTGRLAILTPDNWVYAKDTLGAGGRLNQAAQATDVAVGQTRIAIVTPCGAVYAKDHLGSGGWIQQTDCATATDVEVGPTGRIAFIRTDGEVFAKDDISGPGGWYDQAATAAQLRIGGARLVILTPDSHVYAKDHLGAGGWIDQGAQAVQIAVTKQGRLVLRNAGNYVYTKDDIGPGGWNDQGAQVLSLAG
ncbi:CHAP domain-containing protein [Amycolatopsis sp. NPDC049159]|uniref:CHAP domain-containing protein n=1 Tax=Amycolatopsis sp. NPDC049159 TaxID=3157210 RepID=UPI0033EBE61E